MANRIRQFFQAIIAKKPNEQERRLLHDLLKNMRAEAAFFNMTVQDQRHSLEVYYTALELQQKSKLPVNDMLLKKAALLHDIGKEDIMTTSCKTMAVLLDRFCHDWAVKKVDRKRDFIGRILNRYYYHAEIGAAMLQSMGMPEIAKIVALHHVDEEDLKVLDKMGNRAAFSNELKLLREADDLN